tara:strand:+ start:7867 stop:8208 length:342 start_codon:yes stop_codon:yes gene_type:complete
MKKQSKAWKVRESTIAKLFGTERTPLSGSNSNHGTSSDTLHPKLYIETKTREKHAVFSLMKDTKEKAKQEKKLPVVALCQNKTHGAIICIRQQDLDAFIEIYLNTNPKRCNNG